MLSRTSARHVVLLRSVGDAPELPHCLAGSYPEAITQKELGLVDENGLPLTLLARPAAQADSAAPIPAALVGCVGAATVVAAVVATAFFVR